ncbi:hypothetical protein EVAR_27316_1 [Eumeta japonica]|uniref:Uncharacterized protein n=1 Tax=Eumeta variegata TaxID=151549 RepID=A0A4C1UDP3_EUMVA|nr:hypothetical protein EVAR_27316_1 [Eumeta japonica]
MRGMGKKLKLLAIASAPANSGSSVHKGGFFKPEGQGIGQPWPGHRHRFGDNNVSSPRHAWGVSDQDLDSNFGPTVDYDIGPSCPQFPTLPVSAFDPVSCPMRNLDSVAGQNSISVEPGANSNITI